MKKSLVALAVLAATGAYAQSSVTLYGIVEATSDIGYSQKVESVTSSSFNSATGAGVASSNVLNPITFAPAPLPGVAGPAAGTLVFGAPLPNSTVVTRSEQKNAMRIQDGNSQGTGTSRVGFRGTEDLGGGLKANFLLEMGLRIDDGCTTLTATGGCSNGGGSGDSGGATFGRNAWGGVSGGFGEVRVGRQVLGSFGVQANSWAAGSSNGLYDAGSGTAPPMGGVRFSNAVRYMSPNMGGFRGSLMLSAPETGTGVNTNFNTTTTTAAGVSTVNTTTGASRRTGVDLALEFANGPIYAGFGYNVRDAANIVTGFLGNNTTLTSPGKVTAYTVGGAYDLGIVKPFINYTHQSTINNSVSTFAPASPGLTSSIGVNGESKVRAFSIGLRAPVGAITVIAGVGTARTSGVTTTVGTQSNFVGGPSVTVQNAGNERRQNAAQIGAQYALSKRTLVEANYGVNRLENKTNSTSANNFLAATGVQSINVTDRISAFNVGLKHSF